MTTTTEPPNSPSRPPKRSLADRTWVIATSFVLSIVATVVSIAFSLPDAAEKYGWDNAPWVKASQKDTLELYLEGATSYDQSKLTKAETAASPKTPAATYFDARRRLIAAYLANTENPGPSPTLTLTGNEKARSCRSGQCQTFSSITFDDEDRVMNFDIDGAPVSDFVLDQVSPFDTRQLKVVMKSGVRGRSQQSIFFAVEIENFSDSPLLVDGFEMIDEAVGSQDRIAPRTDSFPRRVESFQSRTAYLSFDSSGRKGWISMRSHRPGTPSRLPDAWIRFGES